MASVGRQKLLSKPVAPVCVRDYKALALEWEKPDVFVRVLHKFAPHIEVKTFLRYNLARCTRSLNSQTVAFHVVLRLRPEATCFEEVLILWLINFPARS